MSKQIEVNVTDLLIDEGFYLPRTKHSSDSFRNYIIAARDFALDHDIVRECLVDQLDWDFVVREYLEWLGYNRGL